MDKYKKIIICHYGKVGSNTLTESLKLSLNKTSAKIKKHALYDEYILVTKDDYLYFTEKYKNDKILIISIFRNLIEVIVSMYFQINGDKLIDKINNNELHENDVIHSYNKISTKYFTYYDKYYKDMQEQLFNFNIYNEFKQNNKKYLFKETDNIDFLLINYADINSWNECFKELFQINNFVIVSKNYSIHKSYYDLYKKTLNNALQSNKNLLKYKNTLHYKFFSK